MNKNNRPDPSPPKRGRPAGTAGTSAAREKLLRTGLIHLTERGYAATGIDDILASAKVSKGSFYHHFSSKSDFGLALIEAYDVYFQSLLDRSLLKGDTPHIDRIALFIEDATCGMKRHNFKRGCLIGNLGQEMGALPEDFRAKIIEVLESWQSRFAACFENAQNDGHLPREKDPAALACFFWIGWEGAILRAKLERSEAPLRCFAEQFQATLSD